MPSKKSSKKSARKQPVRITGKDASILSFIARNGPISKEQTGEFEKHVSRHVYHLVSPTKRSKKGKSGISALSEMKRLAKLDEFRIGQRRGQSRNSALLSKIANRLHPGSV